MDSITCGGLRASPRTPINRAPVPSGDLWPASGAATKLLRPGSSGVGIQPTLRGPRIGRPGYPIAQVRGVLAERVIVSTELDPYMSLKALSGYSGLSVRKLRAYLWDPTHPLPHYRIGGRVLVRRGEYDAWVARYRQVGSPRLDRVVREALHSLR